MLEFHPLANLFPLIEGDDFDRLVADIREHGLRERIVTLDGKILDGRNRYRAGIAVGIIDPDAPAHDGISMQPWCVLFRPEFQGDPLDWVLSLNLHRRHLNETQRAVVAAKIEGFSHGGVRAPAGEQDANRQLDREAASKLLNISPRSTARAAKVLHEGAPELVAKMERGEVAASVAVQLLELPKEKQAQVADLVEPRKLKTVAKQVKRDATEKRLAERQRELPRELHGVILADPPWRFEPYSRETGMDRAADNHYPTQGTDEIMQLPVGTLAAPDCVLFLWATGAMLCDALRVMRFWGFEYKSQFVWVKPNAGTGYWNRSRHELLLVGVRGNIPAPAPGTQWDSVIEAPAGRHSEKPARSYELIESYYPNLSKIELNARRPREGWKAWGLEAPEQGSPDGENGGEVAATAPVAPRDAAGETSRPAASTSPEDEYLALVALDLNRGRHTRQTAEPILRAAYACDPIIPTKQLAADLGHPVGTALTWASRLGLTKAERRGGPDHIGRGMVS